MAYHVDSYDNSIVIDGFDKGIAEDPFSGLSDMRNINIISVPGEASVNFATSKISSPTIAAVTTVTGLSSDAISFAAVIGLENGMAIQFTNVGSLTGVSLATTYWAYSSSGSPVTSIKLYAKYSSFASHTTPVTIGGSAGGATFIVINVGGNSPSSSTTPKYFTYLTSSGKYVMQDGAGLCWSNLFTTTSGYWTFMGLSGTSDSSGRGLAYYQASDGTGFVFAWLNSSIDYFDLQTGLWVWGWKPSDASTHNSNYLTASGLHEAMVAPDGRLYYCDGSGIGSFYQKDPSVAFVPLTLATYTPVVFLGLLPWTDTAQCLAYLGANLLIGGAGNVIYPWDRSSSVISYQLLIAESNIQKMLTVNTNTYILVGNRGRIYVTNGTNAGLFKKIPDHLSGTVEPYFVWGGLTSVKNQLYFGLSAQSNAAAAINQYGGVWAIDLDTKALRLTNQLSYASYSGIASALIGNFGTTPSGTGLFIGWSDGSNTSFGIDGTLGTPYTASQASIDSDLIPIGTFTKPRDLTKVEFKLTRPLVSGESVTIKTRLVFNTSDTGYTTTLTTATVGAISDAGDVNFLNAQWVQFQVVLNSTASSPSYTRLKQIRIMGTVAALSA